MRDSKTTLVLMPRGEAAETWSGVGAILLWNYSLLDAALHAGVTEYGREIARVIFERSIEATTFLDFLTRLPVGFRGDVLMVMANGHGYLSAVSRDEGRYLYNLTPRDVAFYRETVLAGDAMEAPVELAAFGASRRAAS